MHFEYQEQTLVRLLQAVATDGKSHRVEMGAVRRHAAPGNEKAGDKGQAHLGE
jgi:hypothetical protein